MICDRCKAEINLVVPASDNIKIVKDPEGGFKVLWEDGTYSLAPNREFAEGLVAQELRMRTADSATAEHE